MRGQGKDRIAKSEQADEFAVVLVHDEIAKASTVSRRNRDAPSQSGVAEEQLRLAMTSYLDKLRRDPVRLNLASHSETLDQSALAGECRLYRAEADTMLGSLIPKR